MLIGLGDMPNQIARRVLQEWILILDFDGAIGIWELLFETREGQL
jgi:hypothetical protein